jgi:LAO/AO transport system kinase
MFHISNYKKDLAEGNFKSIARAISSIENEDAEVEDFLSNLTPSAIPVIGITGPPGAGKSTLISSLIGNYVLQNKKVAVISVDPSSVKHKGALLGDRIRMKDWYLHPSVYIRSLASRLHLGGLVKSTHKILKFLKSTGFDIVILETVGVGQSEVEVASVANPTLLVLVPEAGDDIQMMKSGLFEVANIFVVNKSDRADAKKFLSHLKISLNDRIQSGEKIGIIETVANTGVGIEALDNCINSFLIQIQPN